MAAPAREPSPPWLPTGPGPSRIPVCSAPALEYLCGAVTAAGVTAALSHRDTDLIMLIPRLRARGVRVPADLAVIMYDDEVAGMADVPLSEGTTRPSRPLRFNGKRGRSLRPTARMNGRTFR